MNYPFLKVALQLGLSEKPPETEVAPPVAPAPAPSPEVKKPEPLKDMFGEVDDPKNKENYETGKGDLFKKLESMAKVPVRYTPDAKHYGGGYYVIKPSEGYDEHIGLENTDPSVLAHELGHSQFGKDNWLGRFSHGDAYNWRAWAPSTTMAGMASHGFTGAKPNWKRTLALATLPSMALQIPTHIAETGANVYGRKALLDAGATEEDMKKFYDKAIYGQGTYLAQSLADIVAGGLLGAPMALMGHR